MLCILFHFGKRISQEQEQNKNVVSKLYTKGPTTLSDYMYSVDNDYSIGNKDKVMVPYILKDTTALASRVEWGRIRLVESSM